MELRDTLFFRFVTNFWIKYQKFRGASRICAIFLNFFLLIFKLATCGVVLLICAPHLAVCALRSGHRMTALKWVLYVILVIVSLTLDIPVLLVSVVLALAACRLLLDCQFITALVCGVICWILIRVETPLLSALFCRSSETGIDEDDEDEEEVELEYGEDEDIDDLIFCQLFTLGEDMCLLIDHVEMCPDETAFIRVVGEEGYTPLYKRKVRRDKRGGRYIVFNGSNYYLDDSKTQPTVIKK